MSNATWKHPDETELLRYLDGELPNGESQRIQGHLEVCWHCRKERNEMEAAIDAFVRFREGAWAAQVPPPPHQWPEMGPRCQAWDEANVSKKALAWPVWRLAAAGLCGIALLATTAIWMQQPKPRSAPARTIALPQKPESAGSKNSAELPIAAAAPRNPTTPAMQKLTYRTEANSANVLEVELSVWRALHLAEADLGEPIEVVPAGQEVLVRATALDPSRAETLRRTVEAIAGARFQAKPVPQPATNTIVGMAERPTVFNARPVLFASEIKARVGGDKALEEFANSVLDQGEAVMARAHAMQRLEQRFASLPLTGAQRKLVDEMQQGHQRVMRREAAALRRLLATVMPAAMTPIAVEPATRPRQMAQAARALDEAISAAFAGAPSRHTDAELLGQIYGALQELAR